MKTFFAILGVVAASEGSTLSLDEDDAMLQSMGVHTTDLSSHRKSLDTVHQVSGFDSVMAETQDQEIQDQNKVEDIDSVMAEIQDQEIQDQNLVEDIDSVMAEIQDQEIQDQNLVEDIAGPELSYKEEFSRNLRVEFLNSLQSEAVRGCASIAHVTTDLKFRIQRDDSKHRSTVKYIRRDTGEVKTFSFYPGYSDNTVLTYDGTNLMCNKGQCEGLPAGENVPVIIVSVDLRPRDGSAHHTHGHWRRNRYDISSSKMVASCFPLAETDEYTNKLHVEFLDASQTAILQKCAADAHVDTDLKFRIQRDDSRHRSTVKYIRRDTGEVKTFSFYPGYSDNTVLTYDGTNLMCNKGQCEGLPGGRNVPAIIVSVDLRPRDGSAHHTHGRWRRNRYDISATKMLASCQGFPLAYTEEYTRKLSVEFLDPLQTPISGCAASAYVDTDLRFRIQRDDSRHRSTVKYIRRDTGEVKTFSFYPGYSDNTVLTYDGTNLMCNKGQCEGLPAGRNVAAIIVSVDLRPREGSAHHTHGHWRRNRYDISGTKMIVDCVQPTPEPTPEPTQWPPLAYEEEFSQNLHREFLNASQAEAIRRCASIAQVVTDLKFRIQRDDSRHRSTVKYIRRDTGEVKAFSFYPGYSDNTVLTYDGTNLMCNKGQCEGLPAGRNVAAIIVSVDLRPRDGSAHHTHGRWRRNRYDISGTKMIADCP